MKKTLFSLASAFAAVAVLFAACNKVDQPQDEQQKPDDKPGQEEVYAEVPFNAITLTAGSETVEGTIGENSVSFKFAEVEDFTACSYNFEVNKGWTCTWPTDPKNVDLTVDENLVLQFTSPKNAIVKYFVSFTSNTLPIVDASKIKVVGDDAAVVEVNNAKKSMKIYFNAQTMTDSNIQLEFQEGALIEGATVANTTFDFSQTLAAEVVIAVGEQQVVYTLKLDKSSLMPNPATLGFSDVTSDYTDAEGVTILMANALTEIPDYRAKYDDINNGYIAETPLSGGEGYYGDWWSYCNGNCAHTVWEGLGDEWVEARPKISIEPIEVVVVMLDETEFAGKMYTDASNSVTSGAVGSFLTISGASSTQGEAGLWADNVWYDDYLDATYAPLKEAYIRTAIGFDAAGVMSMQVAGNAAGQWYKWNKLYDETCAAPDYADFSEWDAVSVAVTVPSHVRGGHKMKVQEIRTSDGWAGETAFGDAWNGRRARMFAGRTHDGRVAYAAFQGAYGMIESLGWEDYNGIGTVQASYILEKLGFKDVIQIATAMYTEDSYKPTIILDGQTLIGDPAQAAKYCIGYDVR